MTEKSEIDEYQAKRQKLNAIDFLLFLLNPSSEEDEINISKCHNLIAELYKELDKDLDSTSSGGRNK